MADGLLSVLLIAGGAALASVAGGVLAFWRQPSTLFLSLSLGFAGGALLATITLEMIPDALERGPVAVAAGGFAAGVLAIYAFDLFMNRGKVAGEEAEQRKAVEEFHQKRPPRGGRVSVLAGGTSIEELIEGAVIGVGVVIQPGMAALIAAAIALDNLSEGLSIGQLIRTEQAGKGRPWKRMLAWTGLIGAAIFGSAVLGWLLFRGLTDPALAFMFAFGGAGMLYLTVTDLVPTAARHHYQQSATLACASGFLAILVLSVLR